MTYWSICHLLSSEIGGKLLGPPTISPPRSLSARVRARRIGEWQVRVCGLKKLVRDFRSGSPIFPKSRPGGRAPKTFWESQKYYAPPPFQESLLGTIYMLLCRPYIKLGFTDKNFGAYLQWIRNRIP